MVVNRARAAREQQGEGQPGMSVQTSLQILVAASPGPTGLSLMEDAEQFRAEATGRYLLLEHTLLLPPL